jgi:serine/threonine-protein kinase
MVTPDQVYSNRYQIIRHLARGGMAEVYLAHDRLLDRDVALKVLFPEFARDPSFVQRFRREAQAAANLNHPNIVAVYDWGEEDGTYFIVMELVEGRTLRDMIRSDGRLDAERAADIAADVAAALSFAHRGGVVHRDVKPGNILITPTGQVKVTDFGIARAGGASEGLTQTGSVMGTATYFSPEQAQGLPVDARSDVYSLGVVLYEMVCGIPPFSGDTPVAIAYKHVREDPVAASRHNPDLPPAFEQIIANAMAKDANNRYSSADDLRDDLLRFTRGQPIGAVPVTALVTEVPTTATATVAVGRAADHTLIGAPAVPYPPRRRTGAFVATLVALLAIVLLLVLLLIRQLSTPAGTIALKDVTGKPLQEARAILEADGFKVEPQFEQNDQVPENQVFNQDPEPGTKLKSGDAVKLKVSQGLGKVKVPDVVNQKEADAKALLDDAGLQAKVTQEPNDKVAEGLVIRTDPPAGTEVAKGSTVAVVVSSGVEKVVVPDVTGLDYADASNQLGLAGFRVKRFEEASDSVNQGKVIRTDPTANAQAPKGSIVNVYVSSGPQQVTVPNVRGKTETDARSQLEGQGFQVDVSHVACGNPANDGRVISQSPSGGSSAPKSSTVSITVCQAGPTSSSSGTTTTTKP